MVAFLCQNKVCLLEPLSWWQSVATRWGQTHGFSSAAAAAIPPMEPSLPCLVIKVAVSPQPCLLAVIPAGDVWEILWQRGGWGEGVSVRVLGTDVA